MGKDLETRLEDLRHLDWTESSVTSATGGSYLKARTGQGSTAVFYKLSCYDEINGVYGHECVNELIAARLMNALCIHHVPYRLVHAVVRIDGQEHETWVSQSASFRKPNESKVALAQFYGWNRLDGEGRLDFCARMGWGKQVQLMMLADYLIANRDRHGGNIEVLKTSDGQIRLAPLFDNGLSLCYSTFNAQQLAGVNPRQDIVASNYLGTRSLEENLIRFVPSKLPVGTLREASKDDIVQGLAAALEGAVSGISGAEFLDFLWCMIWERWCHYESLRDSGFLQAQG